MRFSPSAGPTGNEEHVTGSSPRYTAGRSQGHSHSPGAPASPHQRTPNHFTPIAAAPPRTPAYKRDHDPPRSPVSGPRRTLHGPFQGLPEPSPEPAVRSGPGGHEQHAAGAHAQKYTHAQEPSRVNSHAPGMVAASGRPSQHGGPSRGRVTGVSCDTLTPPYPLTTLSISLPEDGEVST